MPISATKKSSKSWGSQSRASGFFAIFFKSVACNTLGIGEDFREAEQWFFQWRPSSESDGEPSVFVKST